MLTEEMAREDRTMLCSIAYRLILHFNRRRFSDSEINRRICHGFRQGRTQLERCRIDNEVLFAVLSDMSSWQRRGKTVHRVSNLIRIIAQRVEEQANSLDIRSSHKPSFLAHARTLMYPSGFSKNALNPLSATSSKVMRWVMMNYIILDIFRSLGESWNNVCPDRWGKFPRGKTER